MNASISVVIPTWNGLSLLRENLPSVDAACRLYCRQTGYDTEIIVVDDAGEDATAAFLTRVFPHIRLVRRTHNGGFARASNSGFQHCRFPLIALLNNDVELDVEYFLHQAPHFGDPQVFAVTARVFEWDQPVFATGGKVGSFRRGFWSVYYNYDVDPAQASHWIDERKLLSIYAVGGFATFHRSKLLELGGFCELLSPFHWEDIDLSYRAWKRGWTIHYEPRSRARHRTSATIARHFRKSRVETASLRNRLLFHWINLHCFRFLMDHVLMLAVFFLTRITVLDTTFYRALFSALTRLSEVSRLRQESKDRTVLSDRDVAQLLRDFYESAPIQVYYNRREVVENHPECRE